MKAALVLEDGAVFEGFPFAKEGRAVGEAVFYTGVVGYQEAVTNPSYRGTLLVLTYPIIGSYGVNAEDDESPRAWAGGVVIRDYSARYSNFRATGALEDLLVERGVVGLRGVDTRALAVYLRERGEMKGMIVSGDFDAAEALAELRATPSPFSKDLTEPAMRTLEDPGGRRAALLDLGVTRSFLKQIEGTGFNVSAPSESGRGTVPQGAEALIVAGGAGDPARAVAAIAAVKLALGKTRVLGLGGGHEIVALALGCRAARMKVGHHGANHSVRELASGRCLVTAQHHSFAVDNASLPSGVEVTHRNVNDSTVEGIEARAQRARSVSFYPSCDDMGCSSRMLGGFLEGENA